MLLYDAARLDRAADRALSWGDDASAYRIREAADLLRESAAPPVKPKRRAPPKPGPGHAWRTARAVAPRRSKGVQ